MPRFLASTRATTSTPATVSTPATASPRLTWGRATVPRWGLALGLCLGGGLGTGCGAGPTPTPGDGPAAAPGSVEGPAAAQGLPAPGAFATPGLGAWAAAEGLPRNADESALRVALQTTLPAPPALDCVAREYAARFAADGRDPDTGTVQAFATHCGLWARPARTLAVTGKDVAAVEAHLQRLALEALDAPVGLGAVRDAQDRVTVALAIPAHELSLEPVARQRAGATVRVAGRALRGGPVEIWRAVAGAGAAPVTAQVEPDGRFEAEVPLAEAGPTHIEVVHPQSHFKRTLGVVVVDAPAASNYVPHPGGPLAAGAELRRGLLAAINAHRKAAGLAPLAAAETFTAPIEDWMSRVATGTTADPPVGLTDERGWPFAELRYGFTEGADAAQAAALLAATPTGRALMEAPRATRLAVGVRPFSRGAGLDAVVVALTPLDAKVDAQTHSQVLGALNAARAQRQLAPLVADAALAAVAEGAAQAAVAGTLKWADVSAHVAAELGRRGLAPGAFAVGGQSLLDPTRIAWAEEPPALDGRLRAVGLGIAAGPLPGGGPPRHVVIYIVAEQASAGAQAAGGGARGVPVDPTRDPPGDPRPDPAAAPETRTANLGFMD